ncbi:MAG TPA: 3'-5' exonuclease, partial [Prolixibacteraceae bacterium]|nr:3'-5' exonuclease [Prolixibacteraceae bacterium]
FGGQSFYERKEIKDLLAYFRITVNSSDNEALKRVINYPTRGIGQTTLTKAEQKANQEGVSIWEVITNPDRYPAGLNKGTITKILNFVELIKSFKMQLIDNSAYEIALTIARQSGITDELYKDKTTENLSKFENVQELLNAIQDFSVNALEEGRPNKLENYLEEVALITDLDTEKEEDKNKITLMTVHSAKGLEFKNVFIVGVEENVFPSNFSGMLTPENLEEERRLFYVALTRSMNHAWVSFARQRYRYGQLIFGEPSRFISEIDDNYVVLPDNLNMPSFLDQPDENSTFNRPHQQQTNRKTITPPRRTSSPTTPKPQLSNRLTKLRQAQGRPAFNADDPSKVKIGVTVEHQRFGRGKVIDMEGDGSNKKAIVLFSSAGRKQLLLKFARLKVVD